MQSQEQATRDGQAESAQNMFSTGVYKETTLAPVVMNRTLYLKEHESIMQEQVYDV